MSAIEEEKIEMTAAETAFIDRFTADYCRPHEVVTAKRLAAFVAARQAAFLSGGSADFAFAAGDSAPQTVSAPDEEVSFSFVSEGDPDSPGAWKATLVVPPKAGLETVLTLRVEDAKGAAEGLFRLAGTALPLAAGKAEIPFGIFLAGIRDTHVALRRATGPEIPGTLAFFS